MSQDVLVLGLGAMGASACYHLAKRGLRVTALEQFETGHAFGSSHGQSRMIRKAYFEHPDYVPLLQRSYTLWSELSAELQTQIYHQTGIVYFCPENSTLLAGLMQSARLHDIPVERLSPVKLKSWQKIFRAAPDFSSVFEPQAGFLNAEACVAGYTNLAAKHGAKILQERKVISWRAGNGEVEVKTNQEILTAERLIVTAGAWSGELLKNLGLPLKILKKTMFWFPATNAYDEASGAPCFFFELPFGIFYGFPNSKGSPQGLKIAEHSGGLPIGSPETMDRDLDPNELAKATKFVRESLPGVQPKHLSFKTCMYTMTPDEHFIIDRHPNHANVAFAAGFSGHGFKFSSVVGEILADLTMQGSTRHSIDFLKVRK